jgi:hypothetical protein
MSRLVLSTPLTERRTSGSTSDWVHRRHNRQLRYADKSTLAAALAPAIGARVLRSDVIRKHLFGVAPETPLPAIAYTPEVSGRVYDALRQKRSGAGRVLPTGKVPGIRASSRAISFALGAATRMTRTIILINGQPIIRAVVADWHRMCRPRPRSVLLRRIRHCLCRSLETDF